MRIRNKALFLKLLLLILSFCYFGEHALAADIPLRSFYKFDYMTEDTNSKALDPNVMFLLDTSTAMTFTVNGVMPNKDDNRSKQERADLLRQSTYGQGMRPPLFDGVETTLINGGYTSDNNPLVEYEFSYSRYGRDLVTEDNKIGDPLCYYTSDPNKPFLLTFRNRYLAHRDNWFTSSNTFTVPTRYNLANSEAVGGPPTEEEIIEAITSWNAIQQYVPRNYTKDINGNWVATTTLAPVPENLANLHLVPNDSRLYKMKLALWRLTDKINSHIFSRMNVGVAITYQDISTAISGNSVATKNAIKTAVRGEREYYGATRTFRDGNAAQYVVGDLTTNDDRYDIKNNPSDHEYMSQKAKRGVLVDLYKNREPGDVVWNALSRSIMYVPFDKFYTINPDGSANKTEKLDFFRNYISGYESYTALYQKDLDDKDTKELAGAATRPVKDELWASSLTLLSTAIYGGRDAIENTGFPYHKGRSLTLRISDDFTTTEPLVQFAVQPREYAGSTRENVIFLDPLTNLEGFGTGQAIGSVFDFFNPPNTNNATDGLDGVKFGDDTIGFFPVTGSCQSNWLIVFCSGNDVVPNYRPAEAVRRLFQNTRKMRGRRFNGSKWVESEFDMDSGVRTLVIGFIDPNNTAKEVQDISADLKAMAQAGDPVLNSSGVYVDNPDAVPEIASDAEGLVKAFNNVLKRINVERMGSGTVSMPPIIDDIDEPGVRVVFGASYKVNTLDQWTGWLSRYIVKDGGKSELQWEANGLMIGRGLTRSLWTSVANPGSANRNVSIVDASLLRQIVGTNYATVFNNWLHDYGGVPVVGEPIGVLGDMVNSGITVVGKPRHKDLIDNGAINNRNAVVYVQTNRGVLHALNYSNGEEKWGFIPPNIFQYKLRNLRFDGDTFLGGNALTRERSNPMVLLDGMLIARDCENSRAVKTLLTGYLGHGGNGFYTMNITDGGSAPVFEWAIENARYSDTGAVSVANNVKRWGEAGTGNGNYDYTDLGLTIVPGVYFTPDNGDADTIGVLPGGLGHKLGEDSQGKAFYFFNPTNGSIINRIDTTEAGSRNFEAPLNRRLGMGVSPIIYNEVSKKAVAFYTADSEGNIFKCDVQSKKPNEWKLKSIFQLRTIGPSIYYWQSVATPPPGDLPVAIPRKMILAKARTGQVWLLGGTSDLYAPGSYNDESKKLVNKEQFIFGLNVNNIIISGDLGRGINPADAIRTGNMRYNKYYNDGIPAKYGRYGEDYNFDDKIGYRFEQTDFGWVLRLRPKFGVTDAEYLSADPFLMNNVLYIATFIPYCSSISEEACNDIGVGKLYAIDPSTGKSVMKDRQAVMLENIKIAGIAGDASKHSLVLSIKELRVGANAGLYNSGLSGISQIGDNLFELDALGGSPQMDGDTTPPEYDPMVPNVQYWREKF